MARQRGRLLWPLHCSLCGCVTLSSGLVSHQGHLLRHVFWFLLLELAPESRGTFRSSAPSKASVCAPRSGLLLGHPRQLLCVSGVSLRRWTPPRCGVKDGRSQTSGLAVAFVFCGCCNDVPHTGLKPQKLTLSQFWKLEV